MRLENRMISYSEVSIHDVLINEWTDIGDSCAVIATEKSFLCN